MNMDLSLLTQSLFIAFSVVIGSLILFLFHIKSKYTYWKRRGIPGPEPLFFYGNLKEAFQLAKTEAEVITSLSTKYKNEKYFGIYSLWKPIVVVKDLELAKDVFEKNFEHFPNHPAISGKTRDDSILNSLFTMKDATWKTRRQVFNKMFTPKKLKEYGDKDWRSGLTKMMKSIENVVREGGDIELFGVIEDYTVMSVVSSLYGVDLTNNEETLQRLAHMTRFFLYPPAWNVVKFLGFHIYPRLLSFLRVSVMPSWEFREGSKFVDQLMDTRAKYEVQRNDLLATIIKMRKEGVDSVKKISYEEGVGHTFSFLQAGAHTTQATICYVLHYMALYPEVQEKLRKEILAAVTDQSNVTYDELKSMKYLDDVITETLRLRPLLSILKRSCRKEFKVDDKLTIEKDMDVYVDIFYFHMDPNYFPEPEKFKPERYSIGEGDLSAHMPFGKGLRTCIGMTFAMLEIKLALTAILLKYTILESEKMKPIVNDPKALIINVPVDGIWIKLQLRQLL